MDPDPKTGGNSDTDRGKMAEKSMMQPQHKEATGCHKSPGAVKKQGRTLPESLQRKHALRTP